MSREPPPTPTTEHANGDADVRLPVDHDETARPPKEDGQHRANRRPIGQAHADVEAGIQDTERIGTPSDVPSSDDNR